MTNRTENMEAGAGEKVTASRQTKKDTQSRDWMLTIPVRQHAEEDLQSFFESIGAGAVFQRENGEKSGYEHFQCFMQASAPIRFSTLKNHLKKAGMQDAHIEPRRKSVEDCVAYCSKAETRVGETVYVGRIHMRDHQGARNDLVELREKILDGASVDEVLLDDSEAKTARYTRWLGDLVAARDRRQYGTQMRELEVHYLWGAPGVGKTRYIYEHYPIADIYRVTDYRYPFDEYAGQRVLVLDEYDSQFTWENLLCYLDRYPIALPARYHNKQACFTVVWILSNKPLHAQYESIAGERRFAFLRRLTDCRHMLDGGEQVDEPIPNRTGMKEVKTNGDSRDADGAGGDGETALF